jgi:hypothetical protein
MQSKAAGGCLLMGFFDKNQDPPTFRIQGQSGSALRRPKLTQRSLALAFGGLAEHQSDEREGPYDHVHRVRAVAVALNSVLADEADIRWIKRDRSALLSFSWSGWREERRIGLVLDCDLSPLELWDFRAAHPGSPGLKDLAGRETSH